MANISGDIFTEGFVELRKELDRMMMTNPEMEKKVQSIISDVL